MRKNIDHKDNEIVEVNGVPLILQLSYSESVVLLGDRTFCCQTGD